ncbi:MAG TPA: glycosyltransferase family 2 protein [Caulobacteraceae bacterium]|nr:glycosyltransferase family 2 protein [Caulobacteraceae bacterium]
MPTAAPAPISCYIRTKNEAARLGRVIEAARQIAAEVVVVDSGSTDGTVELARSLGAVVYEQPWLGNGTQKRFGEERCTHDWLLDLDADEVVTPELAEEIRRLFAAGEPAKPIYELRLVTAPPIGEPWWGFVNAHRRKLYDRRVVRQPNHKAWDQFEVPPGVEVGRLKAPILHYSFHSLGHIADKLNRVSTVRAEESKLKPRWVTMLRIVFAPPFYFLKHYAVRGLWRAGMYGFALAGISAYGRWLRDVKMYEIHLTRERDRRA